MCAVSKNILLIGHCGPDSSYLRSAVKKAIPGASVSGADTPDDVDAALANRVDLVLLNRVLGYEFEGTSGVDLIAQLKSKNPGLKTMLVSNYPDAQAAAEKAGALKGFGKRDIGSPVVSSLLKSAVGEKVSVPSKG